MVFFFKKREITVPKSNETKTEEAVRLWIVNWYSHHGEFKNHASAVLEYEAFADEEKAQAFATSLKNALKLLRTTHWDDVSVKEQK